jgi:hypothetical protein
MHFKPFTEVFKSGDRVAKMWVKEVSGCGHCEVEAGLWDERVMVGWSVGERLVVHQVERVLWRAGERVRILEVEERERREE